jgi:hypothetical protein
MQILVGEITSTGQESESHPANWNYFQPPVIQQHFYITDFVQKYLLNISQANSELFTCVMG